MSDILSPIVRIIVDTDVSTDMDFYKQIVVAGIARLNNPSAIITLRNIAGDSFDTDVLAYDSDYRATMDLSSEAISNELEYTHYNLLTVQTDEVIGDLCGRVRYEALSFYSTANQDPPVLPPTPTALLTFAKNNIGVRYNMFGYSDADNTYQYLEKIVSLMSAYISHLVYTHLNNIIDNTIITETWDTSAAASESYYVAFPIPITLGTWDTLSTRIRNNSNILFVMYPGVSGHEVTPVVFQNTARMEFPKIWKLHASSDISSLTGVTSSYARVLKREVVTVDNVDQAQIVVQLALGINPVD